MYIIYLNYQQLHWLNKRDDWWGVHWYGIRQIITVKIQIREPMNKQIMKCEHRQPAQFLKTTLQLYLPLEQTESKSKPHLPQLKNQTKPSMQPNHSNNPSINFNNRQLIEKYAILQQALHNQFRYFTHACNKIKEATQAYYFEILNQFISVMECSKKITLNEITGVQNETKKKYQFYSNFISQTIKQMENGSRKKSRDQIIQQFQQLSVFQFPVFCIDPFEKKSFKHFQSLMKELRPSLVLAQKSCSPAQQKQNISIHQPFCSNLSNLKESHIGKVKKPTYQHNTSYRDYEQDMENENTIKKGVYKNYHSNGNHSTNNYVSKGHKTIFNSNTNSHSHGNAAVSSKMCEFSCEEEFQWNPDDINNHKYEKKQIVSQIIMEEPSSCQDSLMLSEIP